MIELQLLVYCTLFGAALAGAIASGYRLLANRPIDFSIDGTAANVAAAATLSVLAGPAIVGRKLLEASGSGALPPSLALVGLAVGGLWSACAGIVVLSVAFAN